MTSFDPDANGEPSDGVEEHLDPDEGSSPFSGFVVAIDGPAGSGKSTVAAAVSEALGIPHIDTGAIYRAAALACLEQGVALSDPGACASMVEGLTIETIGGRTHLDGLDVEEQIRSGSVTQAVSQVAAHRQVRRALAGRQQDAVQPDGGVVEGRDIGTVVLPEADLKVFLTASLSERARRRGEQLGRDDLQALTAELVERDHVDGSRAVAPMAKADDAWELDTTELTTDDVVAAIVDAAIDVRLGSEPGTADPVAARRALPRIAIVGRPNVGKSTLVNRIIGHRVVIVEEKPGVTRDRTEHAAEWLGRDLIIVDTGGWEHRPTGMGARIVEQAEAAIADADLVIFVVDGTLGALEDDERYARSLRRSGVATILAANKIDGDRQEPLVHDLYALGLGQAMPVSALHGRGVAELLDAALDLLPGSTAPAPDASLIPRVAIVGKPNVGKSSLFNRILGQERSIVDAVAHTTRDAVDTLIQIDDRPWTFVDTAGMRRHYRRGEDTELYSVDRTRWAIEGADLVLFVIDASEPLGEQDQRLAALLRDAGRGVILVCNKWDLVDEQRRLALDRELDRLLSFADWAPRVNVSAESGRGVRRLIPQLVSVWENYSRRVPTRELNRLLQEATQQHAPPRRGQKQLRIRYATQPEVRPPQFVLFSNGRLPEGYLRYLERVVRTKYDFSGVPLLMDDRPRTPRGRGRGRR